MYEVWHYLTTSGKNVINEWMTSLRDEDAEAIISVRLARLKAGNFGNCRSVGEGVWELKIDWGPGYRVYYALTGSSVVLLLCGGDKRTQTSDISQAKTYWKDYKRRTRKR